MKLKQSSSRILNGHTKESIRFFFILSGSGKFNEKCIKKFQFVIQSFIHVSIRRQTIIEELLAAVTGDKLTIIIGSLSDDDGEGSSNSEKAIGVI